MTRYHDDDIAVVGIGLRFPGDATSPEAFQEFLLRGRSALSETPADRYNVDAFYHPDQDRLGAVNVRYAHYLRDDISAFDAPFFSITPNEAIFMDPQQRGLLETVYHAFENAGIPITKATGTATSVYIGCFTREYDGVMCRDPEVDLKYIATGTGTALLSNRLSWFYDLRGPSLTLDSACSSSLNAVHLACQGLKTGETNMAVVGGCNLFYNPDTMIPLTSLGFLSPEGKCYTFDSRANGYSRGEGFGVVVLKRLSDAVRDGDTIRSVIRSTSSNQDGKSPGITQPTRPGQEALIRAAYRDANLDVGQTRYFEAHGTGTPMGDPIEAGAISDVFTAARSGEDPMYVGALKTNIGHLEGAAGIAGLIKTVAVLEGGVIPPNLWFEKPNPKIPADEWHLKFPTVPTVWPSQGLRRASVNSFGYGGSNAHVILDDAYNYLKERGIPGHHRTVAHPKVPALVDASHTDADVAPEQINGHNQTNCDSKPSSNVNKVEIESKAHVNGVTNGVSNGDANHTNPNSIKRVFLLSSNDEAGIKRVAESYLEFLDTKALSSPNGDDKNEEKLLADLSFTLSSKRTVLPWRASVVADTVETLRASLKQSPVPIRSSAEGNLALVFTGQGAQWATMGRELLPEFPVFRDALEAADAYYRTTLGCPWSLVEELSKPDDQSTINDAAYSQPICTALQIAIVDLLRSWDVQVGSVVGHSSGEIAAAYAAGSLSRESAWKIAYYRGLLSSRLASSPGGGDGAMLSVALDADAANVLIDEVNSANNEGHLSIACFNSPKNVTVSGNLTKIKALQGLLEKEGVFNRQLKVNLAYHSAYMRDIADEYGRLIGDVGKPQISSFSDSRQKTKTVSFFSSLTGDRLAPAELTDATYWVNNLVSPVRFADAVSKMLTQRPSKAKKLGGAQENSKINPVTELLEVGPHSALQGPLREIMEKIPAAKDVAYQSTMRRTHDACETALAAAGWLFSRGQRVNLDAINSRGSSGTAKDQPAMLTDLPPYPFNHTKSYWKESRLSKGYRFRKHPRLELLGAPAPDWNKSNAIWRNWIRLSENPWVKDHRITGSILYPGAGMLVMAIEASRQLTNPQKPLRGFRLREVNFQAALRVPSSTDGLETHFYLRPYFDSTSSTSSNWNEFQLCSYDNGEWRDHCRGLIQPDYEAAINPIDGGLEKKLFEERAAQEVQEAEVSCARGPVSSKQLYELLHTTGFDFGETFQTLHDVAIDRDRGAVATVRAPNIQAKMAGGYVQPHLIHPATLDGVLQAVIVALTRGGREIREAMIPTSIKDLWISASAGETYEELRLCTRAELLGLRQATAGVTAINPTTREPLITIDGFVSTAISGGQEQSSSSTTRGAHHHLCFNIDWKPDAAFITQDSVRDLFHVPEELASFDPTEVIADVEAICYMYLRRYMNKHDPSKVATDAKPWYQKYTQWAQHQLGRYERGELIHAASRDWDAVAADETAFARLEAKLENATPEAKMSVAVGRKLADILEGTVDPLEIFFNDALMENVYRHGTGAEMGYSYLTSYLDALAHKDPDMVLLEVGAGTGGATVPILETLTRHGESEVGAGRFERYDFTDISPSFFELAKKTFSSTVDRMHFQVLNIEKDPISQDFQPGTYDVIIAGNVLHATKNVDETLRNVRALLKPGGKLILNELTNPSLVRTGFGFGLLPGWWLSEEPHRQWGPLMAVPDWAAHLKRTGFSGVDLCFNDYADAANQINSIIISTADGLSEPEARSLPSTIVVLDGKSELQKAIASDVQAALESLSVECSLIGVDQLTDDFDFDQKLCIFLPEVEGKSFLGGIKEASFKHLQRMSVGLSSWIWLTLGGGPASQNPDSEMVTGFARVIRQENPTLRFITLALESVDHNTSKSVAANAILQIINGNLVRKEKGVAENSYYEKDGVLHISRLVEASYMNEAITSKTETPVAHPQRWDKESSSRALKLVIGAPGLLDTLQFVDDPSYDQPLLEGDVEFKTEAVGLNFLDIMIALGQVIGNDLGVEGSGVVTRTGPNSNFKVGDRVLGIAAGTLATYSRAREVAITRMPDNLSFRSAAGFTVVFVTAYCALYDIADIQPGESVLIHAAAGGVGQACIQLAKLRGAEIYATVGSIEKRKLLVDTYGIAEDHIFSSRDLTFAQGVKRMTGGRGVDVAVNSLSGDALRATWDSIAPFGRFVEVGKVDIYSSARLNMANFKNNVSFAFVDISYVAKNKGRKFKAILEDLMRLVEADKIGELQPTQCFSFAQIQESFRYVQSGVHSGKIVLEPRDEDIIPVVPTTKKRYDLDPNASFVVSGGLGGLGRSIAKWMAERGARNLILLSRSGNTKKSSAALVEELEAMGVKVATPKCDVSDADSLKKALDDCHINKGMPPVKGCVQGSMVLKDSTFANMSLDDYYAALNPKVRASWNLHNLLPRDLDFFILLSSISNVVGNRGQSNYNTGNAFQDGLARYRVLNGLKGTALDLGMILSVGYVAENDSDLIKHLRDVGVEPMREEEFHAILDELCDPALAPQPAIKAQIALGLQMPETRVATGAEEPGWMRDPLFKHLHQIRTLEGGAESDGGKRINLGLVLGAAESFDAAVDIIYDAMLQKLEKALNISAEEVDPTKPLHALGVDSLVAVELRTWMLKQLDADVAVFDLMEASTVRALAELIASRSSLVKSKEEEE